MNPKATNKKTKQRILAKKRTKEIRWNKKILNPKGGRKRGKREQRTYGTHRKQ